MTWSQLHAKHIGYYRTAQLTIFFSSRAKDKSILEAAYLANPKPDKTARLDIVSRVSLNEKEVQVCYVFML